MVAHEKIKSIGSVGDNLFLTAVRNKMIMTLDSFEHEAEMSFNSNLPLTYFPDY